MPACRYEAEPLVLPAAGIAWVVTRWATEGLDGVTGSNRPTKRRGEATDEGMGPQTLSARDHGLDEHVTTPDPRTDFCNYPAHGRP